MNKQEDHHRMMMGRRAFFSKLSLGLGGVALGSLLQAEDTGVMTEQAATDLLNRVRYLDIAPKAKRVIYLFQSGGPSQLETFDYKPLLRDRNGEELPDRVRKGQRLTGMSGNQSSLPLAGSQFDFHQHGRHGAWVCDLFPHTAKIVDDICIIKSMYTEAINHDPAITFFQTGSQIAGRPSIGAWASYGLGSLNSNLPAFVVLVTKGKGGQPLYNHLWSNGFLSSIHQGVKFNPGESPVYYLNNPQGISRASRRNVLDAWKEMQQQKEAEVMDAEINSRIAQYEMAYRMQASVPDVVDMSTEPDYIYSLYGEDSRTPGTYAANCLLARKLAEKDVRFIQLYHQGWDQHGNLPAGIKTQARETDQASAALIRDLKERGILEDTLVIWGGEFGRTNYSQGKLTKTNYGRDHHPRCFSIWMAGAGIKPGIVYGETDDYGYNIVRDKVHVHDFQATLLHLLGINHKKLYKDYQGLRIRLTSVHGHVVHDILS